MTMRARRIIAGLVVLTFLAGGSGHAQRQASVPITEQKKIFLDSAAFVLTQHPEWAANVRILGVGSWMGSNLANSNDIDATLGHPDPDVEKKLVGEINARITSVVNAAHKGKTHKINLIFDQDPDFKELFRGETGQKFVLEYATKKAQGGLATYELTKDGELKANKPAEAYWHETGKPIPTQITHPQMFLQDSTAFVKELDLAGKSELNRALSSAKYLNNINSFLLPGMAAQYTGGGSLDELTIAPALMEQMRVLLKIKQEGLKGPVLENELAKLFPGVRPSQRDAEFATFTKNVENYLERGSVVAAVIDALEQSAKLGPDTKIEASLLNRILTSSVGVVDIAMRLGVDLGATAADRSGRLADIARLAYEAVLGGGVSGQGLVTTLIGWGVPEAAVILGAADIGRTLVVGGVTLTGKAVFFNALNDTRLKEILDPDHPFGLFGKQDFPDQPNPFKGLNRETLYYRFRDQSGDAFRNRITPWAEVYVKRWKESGGRFTTTGAGAFSPELIINQLVKDWEQSRQIAEEVRQLGEKLTAYVRVPTPLVVMLDGTQPPIDPTPTKQTTPGRPATFTLTIIRQFGTVRFLLADINLVDQWGKLGGVEKLKKWLGDNNANPDVFYHHYNQGRREDLTFEASVKNGKGWRLGGRWPGGADRVARPIAATHGGPVTEDSSGFRTERYNLEFIPAPGAGPVTVTMNLAFTDTFARDTPVITRYRIDLTASVEAAVEDSKVVPDTKPPVRIRITPKPDTQVARTPDPPRRIEPPPPPAPTPQPAAPDYSPICKSAMIAIERAHLDTYRTLYGAAGHASIKWVRAFTYDNGDCVGAYVLLGRVDPDPKEYATLEWHIDTGAGRAKATNLKAQYEKGNPDLQWTATASSGSTPVLPSPPRRIEPPAPPPVAPPPVKQPPPPRPSTPPAEKPRPATPPAQPPCPPAPLPGVGNQETNLRCFGIP